MSTTCIIVDNNQQVRHSIRELLKRFIPHSIIVGETDNCIDAIGLINEQNPDVVIVDADVPRGKVLECLQQLNHNRFALIVTGKTDARALQAIKANAVDYLLKPIQPVDFEEACMRALDFINRQQTMGMVQVQGSGAILAQPVADDKLAIKIGNTYELVKATQIVFCRADNNYTEICLSDNRKVLLSKTLKYYENKLQGQNFCRIHQSFLVNMDFVKSIEKGKTSHVVLKDGTVLDVAQARKESVYRMLGL